MKKVVQDWIIGSVFYTYHKEDGVWLGHLCDCGHVVYDIFGREEWVKWLKEELKRTELTPIPSGVLKAFGEGK